MTAQDTENMASVCSDNFMENKLLGIGASPQKQSVAFVSVNANFSPNWGGQSGLFDWSETGLSDTVAKITATQRVRKVESRHVL